MVMDNQQFFFFVTHVEAQKQFLKIWAQTDEQHYLSITSLLRSLQEKFDYYGPSASSTNLQTGTRCVARAMNNEFHRVKVVSLRSDGMVLVQFLDYGMVTFVPIINIRTMEDIPQARQLFLIPDAATPFYLDGVIPIGGAWLDTILTQIGSILVNKRFLGICCQHPNGIKTIKFNVMQEDFSQTLVHRNMAVYSSTFYSDILQLTSPIPVQPLRTPHQVVNHQMQENWRSPSSNYPQKVIQTRSFKAIQLGIGDLYDIKISHIEDGPAKFSVQLLKSINILEAMMEKINSQPHEHLLEPPIAGTICLGRQTNPVNRLCRGILNSPGDTSCKVYFADYGHHETLPFDSIYQIPDEFVTENIFSIRFTLSDISDWKISQEMKDFFETLVSNKLLSIKVCEGPMSPLTQYCELYCQGQSVKDILIRSFPDACMLMYPKAKQLPVGTKENVFVSFVESTSKFFVQIEKDLKFLDNVMEQIETVSQTASKINVAELQENMSCIALYAQDEKWYRASVIGKIDKQRVRVFYVDYGNEEIVTIDNIRKIPSQLVTLAQKQAIECKLDGTTKNKELDRIFEELVCEKPLVLKVINNLSNITVVELYEPQNTAGAIPKNIAQLLRNSSSALTSQQCQLPDEQNCTDTNYKSVQIPPKNQKCNQKAQSPLGQKQQKLKNKNLKTRDHWTNVSDRANNFNSNDTQNAKFRKDHENENRLRNDPAQNNNLDKKGRSEQKRFNQNDQNERSRGNLRNDRDQSRNNSILGSDYSDKDSDTSSRGGGRKNTRNERRDSDDVKNSRQQSNRNRQWENENCNGDRYSRNSPQKSARNIQPNINQPKTSEVEGLKAHTLSKHEVSDSVSPALISNFPPPNITNGAIKKCIMVYFNSPLSFYLQLIPDNNELFALKEKIDDLYQKESERALPISKIVPGLPCIAQYSADKAWYRAIVKSVSNSSASVHFVDYGNDQTVDFSKIKEIEPMLLKLPTQAIHCQLFYCKTYGKEESDSFFKRAANQELEAEFVSKTNDTYHVLLKPSNLTAEYFNQSFAQGVDLIHERDAVRNKSRSAAIKKKSAPATESIKASDYASLNEKWTENNIDLNMKHEVTISWFIDPHNFYCQLNSQSKKFRDMMNEIQNDYVQRSPVSKPKVGASVMALLEQDNVIYRAEILELTKQSDRIKVQYIDYGDTAIVDQSKIYPVEKKFMILPKQAVFCGLTDVSPLKSEWDKDVQNFFQAATFNCILHNSINNKYLVSLEDKGNDIAKLLVDNNYATFSDNQKLKDLSAEELPKIDINLLEGQTLSVKVSNVESVKKFYVQLHTAEKSQATIDSYITATNSEMMPRLLKNEICVGSGCLVYGKRKWRRGVVIRIVKTNYEIRLIDTGEHKKMTLKNMLKLPGQLSVMQNQAIECELFDVSPSGSASEILKKTVTGKTVKIFVEKVERHRLSVRLFDLEGNKIKVVDTQNTEKISPVCSPLILNSTHEVTITWINNSKSIWLQRTSDSNIEEQLLNSMYDCYLQKQEHVTPVQNELYAGLSADGNWYRVTVLEIMDDDVKVEFLDYGNREIIPVNNLRILEPEFHQPYQLGIEVSLTVTLAGSNNEQIDILEPFLKDKKFIATLYNVRRKWVAELCENGEKLSEKLSTMGVAVETTKIQQFRVPELEEMSVGGKYDIRISHVIDSTEVWLHRIEEIPILEELQRNLQRLASDADLKLKEDIKKRSLYLASGSCDKMWNRAEVLSVDDGLITVRFIDYGSLDAIEHGSDNVRILPLPEEWKTIKKFGIPSKLDVVPLNDECNNEISDRLITLSSSGEPLKALVLTDEFPLRIDLLTNNQDSFCKKLIFEKLAAEFTSESELPIEEDEQKDPRATYLSCLISVDEFWVQDDKWVNDLVMIEDRLLMASILPKVDEIKEGLACIALFPDDDKYYRATVISHNKEGTKVQYTDYGNTAITSDLKIIPDDLSKIRPLSQKCRLAKPEGIAEWPQDINEKFSKLSANGATTFLREVIEEGEVSRVKLILNEKDVALELLKMCEKPPIKVNETANQNDAQVNASEERLSPIGQENFTNVEPCGVSYFKCLSDFWINKVINYTDIEYIAARLENGESFSEVTEIKEDKLVAAKYSDNLWYRSKVISQDERGTRVIFVDYGNLGLIENNSEIRELPEELYEIPFMAHHCCLKLPENFEESKVIWEKFLELIDGGCAKFQMRILDKSNNPMLVSLHFEDTDVVDILLNYIKELDENKKLDDSGVHSEDNLLKNSLNVSSVTADVTPEKSISKVSVSRTPSPLKEEKIVPGSVSRGISVEEIDRYKNEHRRSSPDDRIVPGSINKGLKPDFEQQGESLNVETPKSSITAPKSHVAYIKPYELIPRDDKPVPGTASKDASPESERPSTPKIEHSEKLVSGAVNPPKCNLESNDNQD